LTALLHSESGPTTRGGRSGMTASGVGRFGAAKERAETQQFYGISQSDQVRIQVLPERGRRRCCSRTDLSS
jgi:hypothetical protein